MNKAVRRILTGGSIVALCANIPSNAKAQAAGGRRLQRASVAGRIQTTFVPRGINRPPVTVVAVLGGQSVADLQETTGRRLTRQEKDALKAQRRAEQTTAQGAIQALGGRVLGSYQSALNGIKVRISADRLAALRALPGVVEVRHVTTYKPENVIGVPRIQAPLAWAGVNGVHGEGVKVAIIDTGIDFTHANFGGPGTPAAYQAAFVNGALPADPALFGPDAPKVKGGTDLVGDDYDAEGDDAAATPHPDPNPLDCNGHGSHVAGTAAGFGVLSTGTTFSGPYDQLTYINSSFIVGPGVAPKADLYAVRVFGCEGSTDVVTEAIDWAVDNDMVTNVGGIKLMDFGIARVCASHTITRQGSMMGTPGYMAPEQILGQPADIRADVYAVGAILYRLLAGEAPFQGGTTADLIQRQLSEEPPPLRQRRLDVPESYQRIVMRAMRLRWNLDGNARTTKLSLASACLSPGICEPRISKKWLVGERLQKHDEIRPLILRQREPLERRALVRIIVADTLVGAARDGAAAGSVVLDCLFERRDAAVVHVGRGDRDIAERRRFELSDIRRLARDFEEPGIGGRIRERTRKVVQAGVVELHRHHAAARSHGIRKMGAAMAGEAGQRPAVKEHFPTLRGVRDRAILTAEVIAVVSGSG